ncbi:MAG TPA: hypothetical protein V6C71_07370 [Coleofasciculaceae cyanobacterium]|jgi:hypothetical protein
MKPLSVGNVVSAGLRIYRDNFPNYYKLAFIGYLWILVPVYGWAKYSAMMGLISRLAYGEIAEQPETVRDAQRYTKPKMWDFLVAGLLVGLIFLGAMIAYLIVFGIIGVISGVIVEQSSNDLLVVVVSIILITAAVLLLIFGLIWLISRLFLVELPLAVEENITATSTISRSWQLTKGAVGRIQIVVFLAFLISIPIALVINLLSVIIQLIIGSGLDSSANISGLGIIAILIYIIFLLAASALMVPFWQAIKAVIYYDLRVRREGMGIDLRK